MFLLEMCAEFFESLLQSRDFSLDYIENDVCVNIEITMGYVIS